MTIETAHLVGDPRAPKLLTCRGYSHVRTFHRMVIDLDAGSSPSRPSRPGLELRRFDTEGDAHALHEALDEAFAEEWGYEPRAHPAWRERVLEVEQFDPSLFLVVWDGEEIAAASVNYAKRLGDWGFIATLGVRPAWRRRGLGLALLHESFRALRRARRDDGRARSRQREPDRRRRASTSAPACASSGVQTSGARSCARVRSGADSVSALRARCPDCRTLTAVAIGPEYQCHSCGASSPPGSSASRARGAPGGETMADAATIALPYPEAAVVEERDAGGAGREPDAHVAGAAARPRRLLLLARGRDQRRSPRRGRLAVVWVDAHGD